MARRRLVPRRRRIFIGAEGESERSFAKWLGRLCDEADLHVHLDVRVCGGGDSFAVARYALKQYRERYKTYGRFSAGLILLDADRIEEDRSHGRDPLTAIGGERLSLVYLKPKIEGLLFRLYPGYENRPVSAHDAERSLQQLWPEYVKPASANALGRRFKLDDLRRVSWHDADLRRLLAILGLCHNE